ARELPQVDPLEPPLGREPPVEPVQTLGVELADRLEPLGEEPQAIEAVWREELPGRPRLPGPRGLEVEAPALDHLDEGLGPLLERVDRPSEPVEIPGRPEPGALDERQYRLRQLPGRRLLDPVLGEPLELGRVESRPRGAPVLGIEVLAPLLAREVLLAAVGPAE